MNKIQLFCIPYAGGYASFFDVLKPFLDEDIELIELEYAGRGDRKNEKPYASFNAMTRDIAHQINSRMDTSIDYAVFGYSMGSAVAYEILAQKLLSVMPKAFILASHEPPDIEWESKKYAGLDDSDFFDMLISMGGFDNSHKRLLENRFFRKMYFDPIRTDYNFIGEYEMSDRVLLDTKGLVMYSPCDIDSEKISGWGKFFRECKFVQLGNNHFFIKDNARSAADEINKILL